MRLQTYRAVYTARVSPIAWFVISARRSYGSDSLEEHKVRLVWVAVTYRRAHRPLTGTYKTTIIYHPPS